MGDSQVVSRAALHSHDYISVTRCFDLVFNSRIVCEWSSIFRPADNLCILMYICYNAMVLYSSVSDMQLTKKQCLQFGKMSHDFIYLFIFC